jgi:NitT/TauT family transport system permease protein
VIVNTVIGFDRVPASLEKYGRSIGLTDWQKLAHLRLPAARPSIMTGVKLAVVYSISGTIGVEFILSSKGVGKLISYAFNDFRTADMYALILIVLVFAALCHLLLNRFEMSIEKLRSQAVDYGGELPPEFTAADRRKRWGGLNPLEILIVPALIIIVWQTLTTSVGPDKLAGPVAALVALWEGLLDGSWPAEIAVTARDTLIAFAISAVGGLLLGALFGQVRLVREIFAPWLTASFTVPKIVLYPILLFIFGLGATSRIAYGVLHAAPAIVLFTLAGMLAVNPGHLKYATSVQLSPWQRFRHISFPSALPEIVSGLRFGLGTCFLGVLVAEMLFGAGEGAGFAIVQSAIAADTPRLMALIVAVFMLVLLANHLMARLRRAALPSAQPPTGAPAV